MQRRLALVSTVLLVLLAGCTAIEPGDGPRGPSVSETPPEPAGSTTPAATPTAGSENATPAESPAVSFHNCTAVAVTGPIDDFVEVDVAYVADDGDFATDIVEDGAIPAGETRLYHPEKRYDRFVIESVGSLHDGEWREVRNSADCEVPGATE